MDGSRKRSFEGQDEEEKPAAKRPAEASSTAKRMMAMMGFKEGEGLGREGQGIKDPVALSTQRGRRGLGLKVSGFEFTGEVDFDWDSEVVEAKEQVTWLAPYEGPRPLDWARWITEGKEKLNIDDEDKFCDPEVLRSVLNSKSVFDQLDDLELRKARGRCNPFETIGKMFFQNRAALKMANLDAMADFMFTQPKNMQDRPVVGEGELLYFADVCAGPGGFTEYVLWRKGWLAKGFGFTLRGGNDFKLEDFYAASTETFEPCYGEDEDGDVFKPRNIAHFKRHVLANTEGHGVHFMMADGGFSVEGQENIQEILSHQLYLCQCLVALNIVRPGGHFVVKLFDVFTPFSAGLLWLMRRAFHQISIMKPNTSRPANSERYLVCKWRLHDVSEVEQLMWTANEKMQSLKGSGRTVLSLVPEDVLRADEQFIEYLKESNNELGQRQAVSLAKIKAFCQNTTLYEPRQLEMKKECLQLWNVPEKTRTAPRTMRPEDVFAKLGLEWRQICPELNPQILEKNVKMLEWRCYAINSGRMNKKCTLFLSVGRGHVYLLDKSRWSKVDVENVKMELPAETLVFGELVSELRGEARAQMSIKVLHVMDAFVLGGKRVDQLPFEQRLDWCRVFAKAVDRPSRTDLTRVCVKEPFHLDDLDSLFVKLTTKKIKQLSGDRKMCFMLDEGEEQFFMVGGLLFVKVVKEPWTVAFSKSLRRKYLFNVSNGQSTYELPLEACTDFETSIKCRLIWWWDDKVNLAMGEDPDRLDINVVHRVSLVEEMEKQKRNLKMV